MISETMTSQAVKERNPHQGNLNTAPAVNGSGKCDVPPSLAALTAVICEHQNKLKPIEAKLKELLQHQQVLAEGLHGENDRFKEVEATFNLPALFAEVSIYSQKLIRLKAEMNSISERTTRIKRRAIRLQQQQQQKALNQEQARAEQAEREKHLIAKPAWASPPDGQ
ncbi:biogenesis of lysosome-related organelles complex 1 subunit 6-like [Penaeus chinensis]|uniref:biogenesis of lysosome-related organelles complex 1 subunit 6-like n=1 Tax=Penaeus chinensis TaxID=139456 RepID=UPI001FB5E904|nr:biogenesis of lysosome-related organelles complex 1 subunit 6-like [Penaeus chinensis]